MTGLQRLCLITCAVVFGLIVLGGVVRATESGLGCPDWPTCHGSIIPKTDQATLIEFSHRTVASIAGFLVLGLVVVAFRSYRRVPAVLYPAVVIGLLILFQASLGGIAVLNELPPEVVTVHLGTALLILFLLLVLTMTAFSLRQPLRSIGASRELRRLAASALIGTFILMLIGAYIAGAGYGLACSGWPTCNGQIVPDADVASIQIHFLHRVVALLLGLVLLALLWFSWRERGRSASLLPFAAGAFAVYVLQALVGAANIWTELSDAASIAHLGVGTLLWSILGAFTIRLYALYEVLPRSTAVASEPQRLAEAQR